MADMNTAPSAPDSEAPGAPGEPAGSPPPQGGPEDAAKAIFGVMDAISAIGNALEGTLPPDAMKDLQMAGTAYKSFLDKFSQSSGQMPPPAPGGAAPTRGPVDQNVGGIRSAQPAGMPMGPKGVKPIPA